MNFYYYWPNLTMSENLTFSKWRQGRSWDWEFIYFYETYSLFHNTDKN